MNARIDPLEAGSAPVSRRLRVAYLGNNKLEVRGTFTGHTYAFSPHRRVQLVDVADSRVLLRTRYFRRV